MLKKAIQKTAYDNEYLSVQEYAESVRSLQRMLEAVNKTVDIEIAPEDLPGLKGSKYKLCFAKKVGNAAYNVVWQSYKLYLSSNSFSWTPQFQLFGSNTFVGDITVKVSTNVETIGLGQTCKLDSTGLLGPAFDGGPETSITMINDYSSIHPGVMQLSIGLDGSQVSTPIYVAQDAIVTGDAVLTPKETVLVWFEQEIETSTMFSTARSNAVEIDLTFTNSATRLYKDQKWSTPG
jgi:hypothetical protein